MSDVEDWDNISRAIEDEIDGANGEGRTMTDNIRKAVDEFSEHYLKAFLAKGHTPKIDEDDGEVDWFALSIGYHNGPMCTTCHYAGCQHCDPCGDAIPSCTGVPTSWFILSKNKSV